jgi:hypothetical protein
VQDTERVIAIHEAAHAVAAVRMGLVFDRVSAVADDERDIDGALHWLEIHHHLELEMPREALAIVLLAGACAEAKFRRLRFDRVFTGVAASDDRAAIATIGLSADEFLTASADVLSFVDADWLSIERVADELERRRELDFDEVAALVTAD